MNMKPFTPPPLTTHSRRKRRGNRRCAGMTLPELLLACAGTAIVGLAIASMLAAVAYGTSSTQNIRTMVVGQKTISTRLTAAVRGSRMVLASGDDWALLWTADTNGDGLPTVNEIRLIEHDADTMQIRSHQADFTGMTEEEITTANVSYQMEDDFAAAVATLKATAYFPARVWAKNVTAMNLTLNNAQAQSATVMAYRATLRAGDLTDPAIGAAALRSQ